MVEMNRKLYFQLMSIKDPNEEVMKAKRILWANHYRLRQKLIKEAKEAGLRGKDYSNLLVKYDAIPTTEGVF